MLKNPKYVYGSGELVLPGHLNFSTFALDKFWHYNDIVANINGATHESITFREIAQQAINFAISLARMGVRKGDVIGIMSENRQEYFSAVLGVTSTGAVLTAISTGYVKGELIHVLNISKPKHIICSSLTYKTHEKTLRTMRFIKKIILLGNEKADNVIMYNDLIKNNVKYEDFEAVAVNGQQDTLFIIYSSGTTGLPKGVMLTHYGVIISCVLPNATDPSLRALIISPWYHTMGLVGSFAGLLMGRTAVYLPKFEVDLYLKTIEKYKINLLTVVPPVLVAVCKTAIKYDLSSVTQVLSGAAPLHKETITAVYEKFPNLQAILQGYGFSECTLAITKYRITQIELAKRKPGSVGNVTEGCTIKVVDIETREPLGPHQQGEICVKGPIVMKGYIGVKTDDFDEEGFYKTGDVGYYDEDKLLYISDRLKELIKYKGYQVPPAELEALLLTHNAVKDVGVIGIPYGAEEVPLAFVVPQPGSGVTESELIQFVAERLSNPKHLRGGVRFIEQIPKSPSGKILRKDLRKIAKTGKSKL